MAKFIYNFNDTLIKGFYDDEPEKRIFENGACFLDAQGEFCSLMEAETLIILYWGRYGDLREQLKQAIIERDGVCFMPDKLEPGVYMLGECVCKQIKGIKPFVNLYEIEKKLDDAIIDIIVDEAFIEGFTVKGEN